MLLRLSDLNKIKKARPLRKTCFKKPHQTERTLKLTAAAAAFFRSLSWVGRMTWLLTTRSTFRFLFPSFFWVLLRILRLFEIFHEIHLRVKVITLRKLPQEPLYRVGTTPLLIQILINI